MTIKYTRDNALLHYALELSQDSDQYIMFHCSDGDVVARSIFFRLHSRLISGLVDNVPRSLGDRQEYSILLPDVTRAHLLHIIELITDGVSESGSEVTSLYSLATGIFTTAKFLGINISRFGWTWEPVAEAELGHENKEGKKLTEKNSVCISRERHRDQEESIQGKPAPITNDGCKEHVKKLDDKVVEVSGFIYEESMWKDVKIEEEEEEEEEERKVMLSSTVQHQEESSTLNSRQGQSKVKDQYWNEKEKWEKRHNESIVQHQKSNIGPIRTTAAAYSNYFSNNTMNTWGWGHPLFNNNLLPPQGRGLLGPYPRGRGMGDYGR